MIKEGKKELQQVGLNGKDIERAHTQAIDENMRRWFESDEGQKLFKWVE